MGKGRWPILNRRLRPVRWNGDGRWEGLLVCLHLTTVAHARGRLDRVSKAGFAVLHTNPHSGRATIDGDQRAHELMRFFLASFFLPFWKETKNSSESHIVQRRLSDIGNVLVLTFRTLDRSWVLMRSSAVHAPTSIVVQTAVVSTRLASQEPGFTIAFTIAFTQPTGFRSNVVKRPRIQTRKVCT